MSSVVTSPPIAAPIRELSPGLVCRPGVLLHCHIRLGVRLLWPVGVSCGPARDTRLAGVADRVGHHGLLPGGCPCCFVRGVHRAIELVGPRLLLSSGAIVLGAGAIGLSRVQAPWQLYLCAVVMATGWAATTTTAIATTLAHWFERRRGLALSLALNGASAGGFTVAPLLVRQVHRMGLAQAVPLLVLCGLAILLPVIVFGVGRVTAEDRHAPMRDRRDAAQGHGERLTAYAGQAQALRSLHFWSVSLPFALALAAQVGFIVHQVAFLLPHTGQ